MARERKYIDPTNRDLREGIDSIKGFNILKNIDALKGINLNDRVTWKRSMAGLDGVSLTLASIGMHNGEWTMPIVLVGINLFAKMGLASIIRNWGD